MTPGFWTPEGEVSNAKGNVLDCTAMVRMEVTLKAAPLELVVRVRERG
jgi:hypothetical protein